MYSLERRQIDLHAFQLGSLSRVLLLDLPDSLVALCFCFHSKDNVCILPCKSFCSLEPEAGIGSCDDEGPLSERQCLGHLDAGLRSTSCREVDLQQRPCIYSRGQRFLTPAGSGSCHALHCAWSECRLG